MRNKKIKDNAGGRPSKFKSEYCEQVLKLCVLGATDKDIANFFEVDERTINRWKHDYPEFSFALKKGKIEADANVAVSLYRRAVGYIHDDEKIFLHEGKTVRVKITKSYPPDTTAAIFWLKNRQPDYWKDSKVLQGDQKNPVVLASTVLSDEKRAARLKELTEKAQRFLNK